MLLFRMFEGLSIFRFEMLKETEKLMLKSFTYLRWEHKNTMWNITMSKAQPFCKMTWRL